MVAARPNAILVSVFLLTSSISRAALLTEAEYSWAGQGERDRNEGPSSSVALMDNGEHTVGPLGAWGTLTYGVDLDAEATATLTRPFGQHVDHVVGRTRRRRAGARAAWSLNPSRTWTSVRRRVVASVRPFYGERPMGCWDACFSAGLARTNRLDDINASRIHHWPGSRRRMPVRTDLRAD